MVMPTLWHKRHAVMLAAQLPEDPADAKIVLVAMQELMETFLREGGAEEAPRADNVLPFATA